MRKKTDLPLKAPALAKKKSSTALLGKAPPPLKQPEFTINGMDERIL